MAEELSRTGGAATPAHGRPGGLEPSSGHGWVDPVLRVVRAAWLAAWIILFATGNWQAGLVVMFLTGPVMGLVRGPRGSVRRQMRRDRAERSALYDRRVLEHDQRRQGHERVGSARPSWEAHGSWGSYRSWEGHGTSEAPAPPGTPGGPGAVSAPAAPDTAAAERSLAAAVARARSGPSRLDPDALALVDELDAILRPTLARARQGGIDAAVRRDLESIARDHLPETLRAYQQLPPTYAHEHRGTDGRTPAEELRSQLGLLVEGCAPLREAVHGADVARQRELGRFLEAKFRRSDLDL